ncbi:OSCP, subunit 5 of the stator stalk of mitochondrial F1F0 ATP synthase [Hysterangium stoloniferum]|nr:OSCP, subunit 5 of the stator stalk of mitochondrial F1F0 ATP synthase [Hysterangium stoloniferum]
MLLHAARTTAAKTSPALARRAASSIAIKYSNAAYSAALARSPQTLTKVQSELTSIADGIKSSPPLASFVSNPTLSANDRKAGLDTLFTTAGGLKKEPVSDITKNLFTVLSENGRLGETQGVIEGFNELVSKYKGEVEVVVTSATPLDRATLSRLETVLKQSQVGQKAKLLKIANKASAVNPTVLGGLIVDFGDKTIDLSVSSRVNKLNSQLQQSV